MHDAVYLDENSKFFVSCGEVCTNLQGICWFMSLTVEVNKPSISPVLIGIQISIVLYICSDVCLKNSEYSGRDNLTWGKLSSPCSLDLR